MPGVDLTNARSRYREKILVDRCTIRRNPRTRVETSGIDDDTGEALEPTDADETTLATGVPCAASESRLVEQYGDDDTAVKVYDVKLDYYEAPDLEVGDEIEFTTSVDPELDGTSLFVRRVIAGTLRINRKCEATRRFDASNQH